MPPRSLAWRATRRLTSLRRTRPGREVLDIRGLISPLRYDVIVRSQFFSDLRDRHRNEPLATVHDTALGHPYIVWFRYVECARFFSALLDNPDLLRQRFRDRVDGGVRLLDSYQHRGFDSRHPVTATGQRAMTDSGVTVSQRLNIGDGCHRLAVLLMDGQALQPGMCRIRSTSRPVLDNTTLLLKRLDLEAEEYTRFVSHGFANQEYAQMSQLRRDVEQHSPHRLAELDDAVRTHERARR